MNKIKKPFWITIGIAAIFFLVLIVLSAVLQLGERLNAINVYVEYAFYVISAVLFILLFIRPIFVVVFSKTFSMDSLFSNEENARKNYSMYKKVAKNLIGEEYISDEDKALINDNLGNPLKLKE